jgi:hypothetical protein
MVKHDDLCCLYNLYTVVGMMMIFLRIYATLFQYALLPIFHEVIARHLSCCRQSKDQCIFLPVLLLILLVFFLMRSAIMLLLPLYRTILLIVIYTLERKIQNYPHAYKIIDRRLLPLFESPRDQHRS